MAENLPFMGPIGAVRLARIDGKLVPFPTAKEMAESDLDLIVASTHKAVVMIEGFGQELPDDEMAEAIITAHKMNQEIIALQHKLREAAELPPLVPVEMIEDPLIQALHDKYSAELRTAKTITLKADRNAAVKELGTKIVAEMSPADTEGVPAPLQVKTAYHALQERVVREMILDGYRPDGRGPKDLRPISCEVAVLPCAHGSAIFQRGETQALVTTVLGTGADEQRVDGIMEEFSKKFYLDYNMPSFAVGEVRPIRGPGRREIGHGMLAERCLAPILPPEKEFPYTIRVVSDILESNGSSSMASVCGGTLAMMDAGVPISDPVGGISIGLVQDEKTGKFTLLTDIIGDEDHFGDMDFKVAGTQRGVTGIQLDLKNQGITEEIIRATLTQAHEARLEILRTMLRAIKRPREEIAANAPRLIQIQINPEKIGLVIGPGGKTIRRLQDETGAKIDIEDSGVVTLSSPTAEGAEAAAARIQAMTEGVRPGGIYEGRVTSIKDFGAFVEFIPGKDGLVHISELSDGYVGSVTDICRPGDAMLVKVIAVDDQDRVKLSRKAAMADAGSWTSTQAGNGRRAVAAVAIAAARRGGLQVAAAVAAVVTGGDAIEWGATDAPFVREARHVRNPGDQGNRVQSAPPRQYAEIAQLSGGLAHEIRNPLSTMQLNLDLLAEEFQNGESARDRRALQKIERVRKESRRLQGILEDFLRFVRVQELRLQPADLNEVVEVLRDFEEGMATVQGVVIRTHFDADLPKIPLEVDLFKQALYNLIRNALIAMPDGGELILMTRREGDHALLDVIDTGMGIPPEDQSRVFDAFYSTRPGGSGLGLPTVRRIVEAHGGTIGLESEPGKGSKFTIRLPIGNETPGIASDDGPTDPGSRR